MGPEPSAIVLAGGRSRRMGRPKAALNFGELTLLELIVRRLRKSFSEIVVVAAPAALAQLALQDFSAAKIVHDAVPFEGPLAGLKRGLEEVAGDPVFACSCDLPMISPIVARALCEMIGVYDAVIPEVGGIPQPLHAAYRKRCAGKIGELLARGERRATALTEALNVLKTGENHLRQLDPGLMSFVGINTPDQYLAALQMGGFPYH
jgi:molybdenum cofactor guanylyltransferase